MKNRVRNVGLGALAALLIAACGSSASMTSSGNPNQTQAEAQGVGFARCMRSHGVSSFPDPSANGGGFTLTAPGINSSSPAFRTAESDCKDLLPVKHPVSEPPTRQAYVRLLHWANCMRRHGIARLPDPRPDPVPAPGSAQSAGIGTLMGDGGYWVGIPATVNAHSPAFVHLSTACGESPGGHRG